MISLSAFAGLCALFLAHSSYAWGNRDIAIRIPLEQDHTSGAIFGTHCDKTIQETS